MKITLNYETQLKRAIGQGAESLEVGDEANVAQAIRLAADRHGDVARSMLLDAEGNIRPSVLIFIGDQQVPDGQQHPLSEGDTVTLMSPISGG